MAGLRRAALLALALWAAACSDGGSTPVGAVRAFTRAARSGDTKEVLRWLGPGTRTALEREAQAATDLAGGHRVVQPLELFKVGLGEPAYEPVGYSELDQTGDTATVEVRGPGGRRDVVKLVRVKGSWLIELR